MPIIKINNKDYNTDTLSEEAKSQISNIQATDQEIQRLQASLAIAQTARNAYVQALTAALPLEGDTIKFN